MLGFDDEIGVEIHHQGDLPARAGMGSSSSFAVGLIQGLTALRGHMIDRHELAAQAIALEQEWLHDHVGSQDQVAAAYGGFNRIEFPMTGEFRVEPVTIAPPRLRELEGSLLLFYTGMSRLASEVAADVVRNLPHHRDILVRMRALVDDALAILNSDVSLDAFGELMHEGWTLKRQLSTRVASDEVEEVYRKALRGGALGGKLLGAGGSGFMAFFVPPRKQAAVIRALSGYLHVPMRFENEGSRVIYYGRQVDWRRPDVRPERRSSIARRRMEIGEPAPGIP